MFKLGRNWRPEWPGNEAIRVQQELDKVSSYQIPQTLNDSRAAGGSAGLCFLNHAIALLTGCVKHIII